MQMARATSGELEGSSPTIQTDFDIAPKELADGWRFGLVG